MRERIFAEITTERQAQDVVHGGPAHDDTLNHNAWIAVLSRCLGLAASDRGELDPVRFRRQVLRLASAAVACLESLDRQEGRERVAGIPPEARGSGF